MTLESLFDVMDSTKKNIQKRFIGSLHMTKKNMDEFKELLAEGFQRHKELYGTYPLIVQIGESLRTINVIPSECVKEIKYEVIPEEGTFVINYVIYKEFAQQAQDATKILMRVETFVDEEDD